MKKKVKFLVKTAGILLMCIAMMGACQCKSCKDGIDGEDGPQGIPGNAGVRMYTYGSKTSILNMINGQIFESNTLTYAIPLSAEVVGKSAVYAYYKTEADVKNGINDWYLVAGNIFWNIKTVSKLSGSNYIVSFFDDDGTPYPQTLSFGAFKIIVVPVPDENITEVKSAVSIDFGNYGEVAAYYGLPE
jgi:hypothetical protein